MLFKTRTVFTDRAFITNQAVLTIILFVSLLFTAGFAKAAVLNFQTTNQSMWQNGTAGGLNESIFVGTTWDTPTAQIGAIIGDVIQTPGGCTSTANYASNPSSTNYSGNTAKVNRAI